jgi:CMP-N-acetylneuraminic acid synthetase
MYNNQRILAIIPARGGSKGIPNKNITDLCGKPLIAYSILAAKKSQYIDDVIVSTDSEKIQSIASKHGASVPFLRPNELASDTAKTIDAMLYTIEELAKMGQNYNCVVLLQPTQPLRKPVYIDEAIAKLLDSPYDSLVSVTKVSEHPILMRTITKEGTLQSLLPISSTVRRQDFPDYYRVNGSIYVNRINENLNITTSLNDNILPYVMDTMYSVDIDTMEDLYKAASYIQQSHFTLD